MSIKNRIRRLEDRGDEGCLECRLRPVKTHAIFPGEEERPLPEPEYCEKCGRLIELVVFRVVEDEDE